MATSTTFTNSTLLHRTLQFDAALSLIGAAGFLVIGINPLAQLTGFTEPIVPLSVGVLLLAYVGWLFWLTRNPAQQQRQAMAVITVNDLWAVAWLAVIIINPLSLTLLGKLFVGLTVVIVALCAIIEFYAVRKIRA